MSSQHDTLEWQIDSKTFRHYLATPDGLSGEAPGVLVFPEWWGLDDYIKGRCDQLAEQGYVALGVDLYGDGKICQTPDEAAAVMNAMFDENDGLTKRVKTAFEQLKLQAAVDATRTAAIGYCLGGLTALHAARIGLKFNGVASFHGALNSFHTPEPGDIKAKLLVCHGAADAMISDEDVAAFKEQMDSAKADYQWIEYEGALHGFTNPSATERGKNFQTPVAYNEQADQQSWSTLLSFLSDVFGESSHPKTQVA
ncbi:MAG: dienelactone hydrolase family protein [Gammaproteobacteria bacterium]|nr:dienelactone hydrolase family protein [Gammaproteobacteria bacterium]